MKKGVAGVRLCDRSGCYRPWPCATHGTLRVESGPLLVRLERSPVIATARVGLTTWTSEELEDALCDAKCMTCGYSACSCPPIAVAILIGI